MVAIDGTTKVVIDAKNKVSRDVLDANDNDSLPSINTKADEIDSTSGNGMYDFLHAPPPTRYAI